MSPPPDRPKIFHITHLDNLQSIIESGALLPDAEMAHRGGSHMSVGIPGIKEARRLSPVKCFPETKIGEYVPFNFCPRSVMLYILHKGNLTELKYAGGQKPMVHLQADLYDIVDRCNRERRRWAFTPSNARAAYADFYNELKDLDQIDWKAINSTSFSDATIKEHKQAEFLVHGAFPWEWIEEIGVFDVEISRPVNELLKGLPHRPRLGVKPNWYY